MTDFTITPAPLEERAAAIRASILAGTAPETLGIASVNRMKDGLVLVTLPGSAPYEVLEALKHGLIS
jgi:hypothetical protein